jgi:hypothetical protein
MQKEQNKNNTDTIQHKKSVTKYTCIMQSPDNKNSRENMLRIPQQSRSISVPL